MARVFSASSLAAETPPAPPAAVSAQAAAAVPGGPVAPIVTLPQPAMPAAPGSQAAAMPALQALLIEPPMQGASGRLAGGAAPRAGFGPLALADLVDMTKPGITLMVALTTALGFLLAGGAVVSWQLAATLLGTCLVAAGASVLNQFWERSTDALMRRTAGRPLPAGRLDPDVALLFGVALAIGGLLELALAVNALTGALGAVALAGYVFVYTPLKKVSSLSTVVGAIPGALPPMMGWCAVRGEVDLAAWALFGILFFWQMPHFLAIAWLCREDYARGGFPMLPVLDPGGTWTGRQSVLYGAALVPVSLLPSLLGLAGRLYFGGALALGLAYLGFCLGFARRRSNPGARRLMLASLLYLPAVLAVLLLDRLALPAWRLRL
jgi:protoheme IX farnesyltransferase